MTSPNILIAGIGNILQGDDGFGVEVARRLGERSLPPGVKVVAFGVRGFDLAYALLDGYGAVILVEASPRGQPPGTLHVFEPETGAAVEDHRPDPGLGGIVVEPWCLEPLKVLRLVEAMGARPPVVRLVECEPACFCFDGLGLSDPVEKAAEEAVEIIESLVSMILRGEPVQVPPAPAPSSEPVN